MVAIQIRDVSDDVREALAAEAEARSQSLQGFLMGVLEHEAKMAGNRAWLRQVIENPIARAHSGPATEELIRTQRQQRTRQVLGEDDPPVTGRA